MIASEIETFKGFMEIEQRSPHTVRQYIDILNWFQKFLIESNIEFQDLKENDIVKFPLWLKRMKALKEFERKFNRKPTDQELTQYSRESSLHGKSVYKYLSAIRKFLEVNEHPLNWTKIPTPKYDDNFNPDVLTPLEIKKIVDAAAKYCTYQHKTVSEDNCKNCKKYRFPRSEKAAQQRSYPGICFYYEGLKLKAMLSIAYEAALRTDELCNLKKKHLNLDRMEVFIEKPLKHSQPQAIPLSKDLTKILKQYLAENKSLNDDEAILFPTKMGKKYHPNNFATHVFRPIAKTAGFNIRYYTLRHSRATNLLKQGLELGWVRRITRHKNINNVLKYIHLSSDDIRAEMEKRRIL